MTGRLVQAADFQRLLATPMRQKSTHFAVHYVCGVPAPAKRPVKAASKPMDDKLSTGDSPVYPQPVDESPQQRWLGCVVPKRHARRSVTRSLLKRQIRAAVERAALQVPPGKMPLGIWVVRLRSPFTPAEFISAASPALRAAARAELDVLLARACR